MRELEFLRIVIDDLDSCPYLPDQVARMPLYLPTAEITPARIDELLEAGYRRSGALFYRTQCPNCKACEPLRIDVNKFSPNRSQRRVWKRGTEQLRTVMALPQVDAERVRLFNLHRRTRRLDHGNPPVGEGEYRRFLLDAPCDVIEVSLWREERLVAVSITDVGHQGLSAVYCFYDPNEERLSPGTLAILMQVELARQLGCQWLYLGLYVAANRHLNYKAGYLPHQRRQADRWAEFSRDKQK